MPLGRPHQIGYSASYLKIRFKMQTVRRPCASRPGAVISGKKLSRAMGNSKWAILAFFCCLLPGCARVTSSSGKQVEAGPQEGAVPDALSSDHQTKDGPSGPSDSPSTQDGGVGDRGLADRGVGDCGVADRGTVDSTMDIGRYDAGPTCPPVAARSTDLAPSTSPPGRVGVGTIEVGVDSDRLWIYGGPSTGPRSDHPQRRLASGFPVHTCARRSTSAGMWISSAALSIWTTPRAWTFSVGCDPNPPVGGPCDELFALKQPGFRPCQTTRERLLLRPLSPSESIAPRQAPSITPAPPKR